VRKCGVQIQGIRSLVHLLQAPLFRKFSIFYLIQEKKKYFHFVSSPEKRKSHTEGMKKKKNN
jgi:hypothetical protein